MKKVVLTLTFILFNQSLLLACPNGTCEEVSKRFIKLCKEINEGLDHYSTEELKNIDVSNKESLERAKRVTEIYLMNRTNVQLVEDILCEDLYKHPVKVARSKVNKRVYLNELSEKKECNFSKLMSSALKSDEEFTNALRDTNFDPCCIPKMSLDSISTIDKKVRGFSIGIEGGGGVGPFGADLGRELVFIQTSQNEFDVAVVTYKGIETSVGLPYGASTTQAVLTGRCSKIGDYLGTFSSFDLGGIQFSTGLDKSAFKLNSKSTGCNSESIISGATSDLIGVSETNYTLSSSIIRVKGPRLKKLINFFNRSNQRAINRKRSKKSHEGEIGYLADDFWRRITGSKANFDDPVLKECTYDIDDQIKDFISFKN